MTMMTVDIGGILAAMLLSALAFYIITAIYVGRPKITFDPGGGIELAIAVLFPLAWYALAQGITASLGRTGRMLAGIMWVVAFASMAMLGIANTVLHTILRTINVFNPLAYFWSFILHFGANDRPTLLPTSNAVEVTALAVITIVAITASLLQWRRLEA